MLRASGPRRAAEPRGGERGAAAARTRGAGRGDRRAAGGPPSSRRGARPRALPPVPLARLRVDAAVRRRGLRPGRPRRDVGRPGLGRDASSSLIRQVVPAPGVHARNLFHVSAAMWDAWAAYDPTASGYLVTEKHRAGRRDRRPRGGDQLRRVPHPPLALRDRRRPRATPGSSSMPSWPRSATGPTTRRPRATTRRRSATGSPRP